VVKKHPWDEYVRLAVEMKAANSKLTKTQFYRAIGFSTPSQQKQAEHAIGVKLAVEWRRLADGAMDRVQKQAQVKLASILQDIIRVGQVEMKMGAQGLKSPGNDGEGKPIPPPMNPEKAQDFHQLLLSGAKLITSATTILTGNKPIVEATEGDDLDIEFHPAAEGERKKAKPGK